MQASTLRPVHLVAALAAVAIGVLLLLWAPWSAQASGDAPRASNVAMNCAPGQQALVRQSIVEGELNVLVECAAAAVPSAVAYGTEFIPTPALQPAYAPAAAPVVVPAVYSPPPAPRAPVYAPRPASQPRPATTASRVEPKREWGKEALIIGGSAGAGAGIGGLIGGKKGALIGAAIGGGGAALYRVGKD